MDHPDGGVVWRLFSTVNILTTEGRKGRRYFYVMLTYCIVILSLRLDELKLYWRIVIVWILKLDSWIQSGLFIQLSWTISKLFQPLSTSVWNNFYFSAWKLAWNYFKIISRAYCSLWIFSDMFEIILELVQRLK